MRDQNIPIYEFGSFCLNPTERRLLRGDQFIPLTSKLFDLLLLLIKNSGQLVSKEEIMKEIWADSIVEEHNLTVCISLLRKALGEQSGGNRYIETISKQGYRFLPHVRRKFERQIEKKDPISKTIVRDYETIKPSQMINSLAVMPFDNTNENPNLEYISDGITESIIASLSHLPHMKVMARSTVFHYKGQKINVREVGRELNVQWMMVGRVLQMEGDLTISIEIVDVGDGSQLWGEQYNNLLSNIFGLQEEIARDVSEKLRLRLTEEEHRRMVKRYTDDTEAYYLYLKGRYHLNKRTIEGMMKGLSYFHQAIEIDPTYALAYAGVADSYYGLSTSRFHPREVMPKSKAAAIRALELDSMLAEAHASFGLIKMNYDYDWHGAEKEYMRSIELNPNYAQAHHLYGLGLTSVGQFDRALEELKLASNLDPLSYQINAALAAPFYYSRQYEQAVEQLRMVFALGSNFWKAHCILGMTYEQQGQPNQALVEFQEAWRLEKDPTALAGVGRGYVLLGQKDQACEVICQLEALSKQSHVASYHLATIYILLGDREKAFELLEKDYEDRDEWLVFLGVDPAFDNLRSDSRFTDLLRRIGLTNVSKRG